MFVALCNVCTAPTFAPLAALRVCAQGLPPIAAKCPNFNPVASFWNWIAACAACAGNDSSGARLGARSESDWPHPYLRNSCVSCRFDSQLVVGKGSMLGEVQHTCGGAHTLAIAEGVKPCVNSVHGLLAPLRSIWILTSFISSSLVSESEGTGPQVPPFLLTWLATTLFTLYLPIVYIQQWWGTRHGPRCVHLESR
jgi:hypothetical protein